MTDETTISAADAALENQLLQQLAAFRVVTVLGVVAPPGASGRKSPDDALWTLAFTFHAWRIEAAGLQSQELTIRRKVTDEELDRFKPLITPYTVLRIRAHVVRKTLFGGPQALLAGIVGIDTSDTALNDLAEQLKPVTYEDAYLGTFTLDRSINSFQAEVVWDGKRVSLYLKAREPSDIQKALKTAHSLWQSQDVWNQRICDCAVQWLLSHKNATWLDEDEAALTADQFTDRMTLESVGVYSDGSFEFWHHDGNMFQRHSILVSGSLSAGPTSAQIAG